MRTPSCAAATLLALGLAAPAAHAQQHNLLFILSEDMGPQLSHPACAGFASAQVQTPNLDALAARGLLFPNAHVTTPVCSSSRTSVLTGLHNHTNRVRGNTRNYFYPMRREQSDAITDRTCRQASIPREFPTMIELLRDAGYHTGVSQKQHMSPNDKLPDGEHRLIQRWRVNDPRAFNIDMFKIGYGGDATNGDTYRDIVQNRAADPERFTWLARMHNFRFKVTNPQYQLHHTAADRFERVDILEDPAAAATRNRLLVALHAWAHESNDIDSPLKVGFAAETVLDPLEPVQVMNEDDANHPSTQYVKYTIHTGALDPDWRTRAFGNTGIDFTMTAGVLDAPAGVAPLATHESLRLMPGQGFTATVKTRFAGVGVGGGLVFGFQDTANYWSLQLLDGNTTVGGANKDARLVRVVGGVEQVLQLVGDLPNITPNE